LTEQGGLDEIRHLVAVRTPIYEACADLTIDVERLDASQIARKIAAALPPTGPA
jgi:hypothetical protein